MSIEVALDKVLFHNEKNEYAVLRLKTADGGVPESARSPYRFADHLIRFTAVGYGLPVTDAVRFTVEGEWAETKYGTQLQVSEWREIVPPTEEGVRNYLASGLLKGIGEKTADEIVRRFGVNALSVLENQPERLLEVRGITQERLEEIRSGYAQSRRMRDLMILLAPFKVTPTTAQKIYEHFGPSCAEVVRKSPYNLCQVHGFGFKRVDAIVQKSGGDLHDPQRVNGALFYTLQEARGKDGHLYLEGDILQKNARQLLNESIPIPSMRLSAEEVAKALESMILEKTVVSDKGNIYLPAVYLQEVEAAKHITQILLAKNDTPDIVGALTAVKRQLGITLSQRQLEGVEMVFRNNLSIITGGPGTGKSTVLKAVIEVHKRLYPDAKMLLAAPTGKASRRMAETTGIVEAQTLHAMLGLRGDDNDFEGVVGKSLDASLVIVDESSMVDMWLAQRLFNRIQPGTRVLLVGDADQLESVGAGDVFRKLIESGVVPVTVLDEIFRQAKDSLIAYNARFINENQTNLYYGDDFTFQKAEDQTEAAEIVLRLFQEQAARAGVEQVEVLCPFRTEGDVSALNMNETIRETVNPAMRTTPELQAGGKSFRLHDRVMQVKNNYEIALRDKDGNQVGAGVFNGDIGTVCAVEDTTITVDYDGRFAIYPTDDFDELELAYALTIHKSQGSEYDTVIIPVMMAHKIILTRSVLYTAVTRAKRRVYLVGEKRALYMAIHSNSKGKRNTMLGERIKLLYTAKTRKPSPQLSEEDEKLRRAS